MLYSKTYSDCVEQQMCEGAQHMIDLKNRIKGLGVSHAKCSFTPVLSQWKSAKHNQIKNATTTNLPFELWKLILDDLPCYGNLPMSLVCKTFRNIIITKIVKINMLSEFIWAIVRQDYLSLKYANHKIIETYLDKQYELYFSYHNKKNNKRQYTIFLNSSPICFLLTQEFADYLANESNRKLKCHTIILKQI
jgi:hypothetical protein